MPLYRCEKCGCIENTAMGFYWGKYKKLCSKCSTGKWHRVFRKKSAKGLLLCNDGFLYHSKEVKKDSKSGVRWRIENKGLKIVKEITEW